MREIVTDLWSWLERGERLALGNQATAATLTEPDGTVRQYTYEYDPVTGALIRKTDTLSGEETEYDYDDFGNLRHVTLHARILDLRHRCLPLNSPLRNRTRAANGLQAPWLRCEILNKSHDFASGFAPCPGA